MREEFSRFCQQLFQRDSSMSELQNSSDVGGLHFCYNPPRYWPDFYVRLDQLFLSDSLREEVLARISIGWQSLLMTCSADTFLFLPQVVATRRRSVRLAPSW